MGNAVQVSSSGAAGPHVVLLGDSIFDNQPYVSPAPAVIDQLTAALPPGARASLLAVDGSCTRHVAEQLAHLPADATHLLISVGGNDALGASDLVHERASNISGALLRLAEVAAAFGRDYEPMLDRVLSFGLPAAVCTIYDGAFQEHPRRIVLPAALCHFNDVILRAACRRGVDVIDLRVIFTDAGDYANPIEPGPRGGAKMVGRMSSWMQSGGPPATTRLFR